MATSIVFIILINRYTLKRGETRKEFETIMMKTKHRKYDAEYISYINNGKSAAVFITRDIAKSIPTNGKWIDVESVEGRKLSNGRWDFRSIVVELFPRIHRPNYPKGASDREKKYITWITATEDIEAQRERGVHGPKYCIFPKLINLNKGKCETVKAAWNNRLQRWVGDNQFSPSCEWRWRRKEVEPEWQYIIIKVKRMP